MEKLNEDMEDVNQDASGQSNRLRAVYRSESNDDLIEARQSDKPQLRIDTSNTSAGSHADHDQRQYLDSAGRQQIHRPYKFGEKVLQRIAKLVYFVTGIDLFTRWLSQRDIDMDGDQSDDTANIVYSVQYDDYGRQLVEINDKSQQRNVLFQFGDLRQHSSPKDKLPIKDQQSDAAPQWIDIRELQENPSRYKLKHFLDLEGNQNTDELTLVVKEVKRLQKSIPTQETRQYRLKSLLGWGGNGIVLEATTRNTKENVAIKCLPKVNFIDPSSTVFDEHYNRLVPMELHILRVLQSVPGVVKLIDWFEGPDYIFVVMERVASFAYSISQSPVSPQSNMIMKSSKINNSNAPTVQHRQQMVIPNSSSALSSRSSSIQSNVFIKKPLRNDQGSLYHFIQTQSHVACQPAVYKNIFRQLVNIFSAINLLDIAYLDFKLENVLVIEHAPAHPKSGKLRTVGKLFEWSNRRKTNLQITDTRNTQYVVKLVDFGMARYLEPGSKFYRYGTSFMASPEVLSGKGYYGPEADIWALGLILYSMATGGRHYQPSAIQDSREPGVQSGQSNINNSPELQEIDEHATRLVLQRMLHSDQNKRAQISEVLSLIKNW
ncbi:hypothetical protein MIR68_006119 [Amoeboaphelidium protococcarum]|nr:hypothetical protein MIR68_006119 [Amoeboaphelidium protococcarum]